MAAKEITLVPLQSIVLYRDGKAYTPPIGAPFVFYENEVDEVDAIVKSDGIERYRKPVVEQAAAKPAAPASKNPPKAGAGANDTDL